MKQQISIFNKKGEALNTILLILLVLAFLIIIFICILATLNIPRYTEACNDLGYNKFVGGRDVDYCTDKSKGSVLVTVECTGFITLDCKATPVSTKEYLK